MLLHDVVGINCKNCATTENQGVGVKYMGSRYVVDCVFYLAGHDYPSLVEREGHGL